MNSKTNPISSLLQDIEIRYYWVMSRIVQSQRKNSSRVVYINSASSDGAAITEKQNSRLFNSQTETIQYEKQLGVVV